VEDPRDPSGPVTREASLGDRLKAALQVPLPHHLLSRLVFAVTRSRLRPLESALIRSAVRLYGIDLAQAAEPDPAAYPSFNAFFTRPLAPGARPVDDDPRAVVSPVDGVVSQAGEVRGGRIFQAKGRDYTAAELLGGSEERAAPFTGGSFAALYLSPRDYHRVHAPLAGTLRETVHVPGRLFSVNAATTRAVPRLFARNERVAAIFDTAAGPMAVVLVGALCVSAIETVWSGLVTPPRGRRVRSRPPERPVRLAAGEELGRFNMGSTVVVLFGPGRVRWSPELVPEAEVRMGRRIGTLATPPDGTGNSGRVERISPPVGPRVPPAGPGPDTHRDRARQREEIAVTQHQERPERTETAVFAAGCFWGVEETFRRLGGVVDTSVGYTGGTRPEPTYREVCTGATGHAEAVRVEYDPERISYDQLLRVFWDNHDPTQVDRQGPDVGSQYRSEIFVHSPAQAAAARASREAEDVSGRHRRPIATRISPAAEFWPAEDYHQRYLEKRGLSHCAI